MLEEIYTALSNGTQQRYPYARGACSDLKYYKQTTESSDAMQKALLHEVSTLLGVTELSTSIREPMETTCIKLIKEHEENSILEPKPNIGQLYLITTYSGRIEIKLTNRLNRDEKYIHYFSNCSTQYLAFCSDFDIEMNYITHTRNKIWLYRFEYKDRESFTPNPEVITITKVIEKMRSSYNPSSAAIFENGEKEPSKSSGFLPLFQYQKVENIRKVLYAIDLFNNNFDSPIIGGSYGELSSYDLHGLSSFVRKQIYLNGVSTDLREKLNEPLTKWNSRSKCLENIEEISFSKVLFGIIITMPILPEEIINKLKSGTTCEGSTYNVLLSVTIQKLKNSKNETSFQSNFSNLIDVLLDIPKTPIDIFNIFKQIHFRDNEFVYPVPSEFLIRMIKKCKTFNIDFIQLLDNLQSYDLSMSGFVYSSLNNLIIEENMLNKELSEEKEKILKVYESSLISFLTFVKESEEFQENELNVIQFVTSSLCEVDDKENVGKCLEHILQLEKIAVNHTILKYVQKNFNNQLKLIFSKQRKRALRSCFTQFYEKQEKLELELVLLYATTSDIIFEDDDYFMKLCIMFQYYPDEFVKFLAPQDFEFNYGKYFYIYRYFGDEITEKLLQITQFSDYYELLCSFDHDRNYLYIKYIARNLFKDEDFIKVDMDDRLITTVFKFLNKNEDDILFILDNEILYNLIIYEKLLKYGFDESQILSLFKGRKFTKNSEELNPYIANILQNRDLRTFEMEYLKVYLSLNQKLNIKTKIKLALYTKDIEYITESISHFKDFIDEYISKGERIIVIYSELHEFFLGIIEFGKKFTDINLIDGCRVVANNIIESCESFLKQPKTSHSIKLLERFYGCDLERLNRCNCTYCLKLFSALEENTISKKFRVKSTEDLNHLTEQINNGIIGYAIFLEMTLKDCISIETKPWGKSKSEIQITITKKCKFIEPKYQIACAVISIVSDLLLQYIPSNQKRVNRPVASSKEPPTKIQKTS